MKSEVYSEMGKFYNRNQISPVVLYKMLNGVYENEKIIVRHYGACYDTINSPGTRVPTSEE